MWVLHHDWDMKLKPSRVKPLNLQINATHSKPSPNHFFLGAIQTKPFDESPHCFLEMGIY
jgi:hypothetical protein